MSEKDLTEISSRFAISGDNAEEKFKRDTPPSPEEYAIFKKKNNSKDSKYVDKKRNKKNTNSLKTNHSSSKEAKKSGEVNSDRFKQTDNLTGQKKKSKQKDRITDKEKEERLRQEAEKRAKEISKELKIKPEARRKKAHNP